MTYRSIVILSSIRVQVARRKKYNEKYLFDFPLGIMISSDFSWRFLELFESAQISTVVYRIYRLFQAISRSDPEVQN